MKKFFMLLMTALSVVLLVLVGCGDDDGGGDTTPTVKEDAGVTVQEDALGEAPQEDVATVQDPDVGEEVVEPSYTVSDLPAGMGPMVQVTTLAIGGEDEGFDMDGDGTVDNGLAVLGNLANALIPGFIASGDLVLIVEFAGLDDEATPAGADVNLRFYLGAMEDGEVYIDKMSFEEDGTPMIQFPGAEVAGGVLTAGPGQFPLEIPMGDDVFSFLIDQVQITSDVAPNVASLTGGVLGGMVMVSGLNDVIIPAELGAIVGLDEGSLLGLLAQGLPGVIEPLQPDVDNDDDGCERFSANDSGIVDTCVDCTCTDVDGETYANPCDCTEETIEGEDCVDNPGFQDAYSIAITFEGDMVEVAGVIEYEEEE